MFCRLAGVLLLGVFLAALVPGCGRGIAPPSDSGPPGVDGFWNYDGAWPGKDGPWPRVDRSFPPDRRWPRETFPAFDTSTLKETVTCYFVMSSTLQTCYSSKGPSCSGYSSCSVAIYGYYGEKVDWKSSCGGSQTTFLDGKNDTISFSCNTVGITEAVTCNFGTTSYQSCWSPYGSCSGYGSCTAKVSGPKGASVIWSSTCGSGSNPTYLDGIGESVYFKCPSTTTETVTCYFSGSTTMQNCSSSKGVGCSGISSCQVTVSGYTGEVVSWKTTCGSSPYTTTVIDGKNEFLTFYCAPTMVKETVTCLFKGSTTYQTCSSPKGTCQGLLGCTIQVSGALGEQVYWKSSCGGSWVTIMDGKDESANFTCYGGLDGGPWPPPPPPPPPPIPWPDAGI